MGWCGEGEDEGEGRVRVIGIYIEPFTLLFVLTALVDFIFKTVEQHPLMYKTSHPFK